MGMTARLHHRVGMIDVDAVQINFAAYFRWMDMGYMRLLSELGHPLSSLLEAGASTPAVDAHCSYRTPARLDDIVEAHCWISEVGRSSYFVRHEFFRDQTKVAEGHVKHVWIQMPDAKPIDVPAWLREAGGSPS
jgi:acyl-CoA thioester hydrolase